MLLPEEHNKRLELYNRGYTDTQMAQELYVSTNAVWMWRRKHNLPCKYSLYKEELEKQRLACYNEGMTDEEMASCLNLSVKYVGKWRNKYKLKPNKK